GMLAFLASEVAFFGTLIMTYVFYLPDIRGGDPKPSEIFSWTYVLIGTACLLTSSVTVHFAEHALSRGHRGRFLPLCGATVLLGAAFLVVTGLEWSDLIGRFGLTPWRNHFGSCYFTLVGFHAAHVTMGVLMLSAVFGLVASGRITERN